jgi:hypothetical protein
MTSTFTALIAILAAGCGTSPSGGGGGDGSFPLASLDADCFGVTGKMVLSAVEPEYATTLTYMGTQPNAGSTTPLTIRIRYEQGAIGCVPPHNGPDTPVFGAEVGVQVRLDFMTGDGAFAETLDTALDGKDASQASFFVPIAPTAIAGTFKPNLPGATNVTVHIYGSAAGPTTRGGVDAEGGLSASSGEQRVLAGW